MSRPVNPLAGFFYGIVAILVILLVTAGWVTISRSVKDEPVPIVKSSSDYNPKSTTSADGRFIRTEIEFSPGVIYIHIKDTKQYGYEYLETQSSIIRL